MTDKNDKTVTDDSKRYKIRTRIRQIEKEIDSELDFREFGATKDFDWKMSDARLAGLKAEKEKLEEYL